VPRLMHVSGDTLDGALEEMCRIQPSLAIHLFDESGGFREHVLCFVNDTNSRETGASKLVLHDGDTITILQAVSGG